MSGTIPTNAFPLPERFYAFPSAFQPYFRASNDFFHNNEIGQPQILSASGDANLFNCGDTFKTFTELKNMPFQAHPNVTDFARLTMPDSLPVRVLPSPFFQPFATPQIISHYDYAGNSSITPLAGVTDILRQHQVRRQATPFPNYGLPLKQEAALKPQTPSLRNEDDDDDTLYVNAKQFARIMQRREARMKLEREGKISRMRKKYLHESRHLHALARMRGEGGKFGRRREKLVLPPIWPDFPTAEPGNTQQLQTVPSPVAEEVAEEQPAPATETPKQRRKRRSRVVASRKKRAH